MLSNLTIMQCICNTPTCHKLRNHFSAHGLPGIPALAKHHWANRKTYLTQHYDDQLQSYMTAILNQHDLVGYISPPLLIGY